MKTEIERRKPNGFADYAALSITTFGVGYLPLAPGTWGSMVGVAIYVAFEWVTAIAAISIYGPDGPLGESFYSPTRAVAGLLLVLFCLIGVWAAGRATELLGNLDPSEAVVDEVMGQLIVFLFIPFTFSWKLILAGFLLFRLFDIWKPYPIRSLENLPTGLGICADDIVAGVYAGIVLSFIYALSFAV
ncbi:MAG: phosphatidylglycerophosphatase A [Acidobacteriota bacterium]